MPRVLLVDDEPNIRWTMAELLKREGYETIAASDFDSAIAAVEREQPDAAVVDIIMPRKDGIALLKELRERDEYLPVVMITGEPNVSHLPELIRAGAYDFISKPVVKEVLIRAVANAVEKKRLVDEKRRLEQQIKEHAEQLELAVKKRTEQLAAAHSFLNTVLDSSTEYAIMVIDTEGRVTLFNRGAELIFGYGEQEARGRMAAEMITSAAPGERPLLACGRNSEECGRYQQEMRLRRADQSTFTASVTMTPIRGPEGAAVGYLGIIKDLTAERRSEEHLRQMRERLAHNEKIAALGRMAAQVAHEVRNPLAGLRLYSLHLKGKVADKLAANELSLIDKIIDGINQLSDTVDRVLNFARPLTLSRSLADLNRVVADSVPLLEPQLSAKRIKVELRLCPEGAYAMLDEATMRSAIINLALNSIQAMTDGGYLVLSTSCAGEAVELVVADTGVGMTEEQVKNIFEPFYTTKSQGLGLGMSFVAKVIEQHGGSVAVRSSVGKGTEIKITLPAEGEKADEARGANPSS